MQLRAWKLLKGRCWWVLWGAALAWALVPADAAETAPKAVEFNRDVRPILSDACFACHGPDKNKRKADLRLDTEEGAVAARGETKVIVPGDPAHSEVFRRITSADEKERMPPARSGRRLTLAQVEVVRRWIEQGAKSQKHWALLSPQRPPLPAVKDPAWPRTPVDHFILERLEREGLRPSPEAEKATLLRRVTLDLT